MENLVEKSLVFVSEVDDGLMAYIAIFVEILLVLIQT